MRGLPFVLCAMGFCIWFGCTVGGSDAPDAREAGPESEDQGDSWTGFDDGPAEDAGVEAESVLDVFGPDVPCIDRVRFLTDWAEARVTGCTDADGCTAFGHVIGEFPPPSCDCKTWIAPLDRTDEGLVIAAGTEVPEAIADLLAEVERDCRHEPTWRWGWYCDTLHVWVRLACEDARCRAYHDADPTFCNDP